MLETKTYSLKKALIIALIVSLGFVAANYFVSTTLERFRAVLLPDTGAAWYYWKLPMPQLWATITMWVLYAAHQLSVWVLIFRLKDQPLLQKGRNWKNKFLASYSQCRVHRGCIFYRQLSFTTRLQQFVPVMSSQGSVIVMLVFILIMLNQRRGLFFGKKSSAAKRRCKPRSKSSRVFYSVGQ